MGTWGECGMAGCDGIVDIASVMALTSLTESVRDAADRVFTSADALGIAGR